MFFIQICSRYQFRILCVKINLFSDSNQVNAQKKIASLSMHTSSQITLRTILKIHWITVHQLNLVFILHIFNLFTIPKPPNFRTITQHRLYYCFEQFEYIVQKKISKFSLLTLPKIPVWSLLYRKTENFHGEIETLTFHYVPHRRGLEHIAFGVDPFSVSVGVIVSCLHDIS